MTKKPDWVEIAERKTTGEFITVIDRDAKMTNREWLFAMSNRELAEFILCPMIKPEIARSMWKLCAACPGKTKCTGEKPCPGAFAAWLEAEAE